MRQVSFSDDGSILVSVDDSSIVAQYDRVYPRERAAPTAMDVDK